MNLRDATEVLATRGMYLAHGLRRKSWGVGHLQEIHLGIVWQHGYDQSHSGPRVECVREDGSVCILSAEDAAAEDWEVV